MSLQALEPSSAPSGYVCLPPELVTDARTGLPPMGTELLMLDGCFPLGSPARPIGPGKFNVSIVGALLGGDSRRSVTTYRHALIIEEPTQLRFCAPGEFVISMRRSPVVATDPVVAARVQSEGGRPSTVAETPAEEVRRLTGLSPVLLARLFGVSRTTYYKWIEGATPRDARFQHLVDVLAHVKDAQRRLASTFDVATWLRTPVAPGGQRPLDYLQQRRFSTFRGLVLRERSAEVKLNAPLPSALGGATLSRAQYLTARERISPTPRVEHESEVDPNEAEVDPNEDESA